MKKPIVTLEQVKEIEKTYPTPFHIYDEKAIRENARALKEAFSWNKGYREYFAGRRLRRGLLFFDRAYAFRSIGLQKR